MKFKILVIDDEKNIREGLQMALEDEGYEVLTAEDGTDGLHKALSGCRASAGRKSSVG